MTLLQALVGCDVCPPGEPVEGRLFAEVAGRRLCAAHWKAAGRPWPRGTSSTAEVHEAELRTRKRMLARGGAHRHIVRKGLS